MSEQPLLGGLGRACYRHRWITLLTWVIGVACLIALWQQFGAAALNSFNSNDPGQTVLNQHFPRTSGDTLILAVLARQDGAWRIKALENVTLTNPRTGQVVLRGD